MIGKSTAQPLVNFKDHSLPMRGTVFLEYIMSGKKKYEGRINGPACRAMEVGEHLQLLIGKQAGGLFLKLLVRIYIKLLKRCCVPCQRSIGYVATIRKSWNRAIYRRAPATRSTSL